MLQVDVNIERSTLSTLGLYPLSEFSTRHRLMATLIREEAEESLLPSIRGDSELAALIEVLNRYKISWWFKQLSCVGADPARYWREKLGEEIKAATRGKSSTSQRKKKFLWWAHPSSVFGVTYELSKHDLVPFYGLHPYA